MGDTVGPLVDMLLWRLRDAKAQGSTRDLVRQFLAHAEGLAAIAFGAYVEAFPLTLSPARCLYSLRDLPEGTRIHRVVAVREDNRDVHRAPALDAYTAYSMRWFRATGPRTEAWTPLGKDLLVLWPAPSAARSIEIRAIATPRLLEVGDTWSDLATLTLDPRWTPAVLDIAEMLLLLRYRRLDALAAPIERLKALKAIT